MNQKLYINKKKYNISNKNKIFKYYLSNQTNNNNNLNKNNIIYLTA